MQRLTLADIREMSLTVLLETTDAVLARYDPPDQETQQARLDRLTSTLDEMPAIYRWCCSMLAVCDQLTDGMREQFGVNSHQYKEARQRRDAMEKRASAARLRYEGASRIITVILSFDETGMPTSRRAAEGN